MKPIKRPCKVCGSETTTVFNINLTATPICESCAASIFIQQAQWYMQSQTNQSCPANTPSPKE